MGEVLTLPSEKQTKFIYSTMTSEIVCLFCCQTKKWYVLFYLWFEMFLLSKQGSRVFVQCICKAALMNFIVKSFYLVSHDTLHLDSVWCKDLSKSGIILFDYVNDLFKVWLYSFISQSIPLKFCVKWNWFMSNKHE